MAKSGRRVQANARTLSYAVRQYFRPALREIQPGVGISNGDNSSKAIGSPEASTSRAAYAEESVVTPTPDDQLIPTQPEYPGQNIRQSEKSLGKRKRVENGEEADDALNTTRPSSSTAQTRFTQSNIPAALKKCMSGRPI